MTMFRVGMLVVCIDASPQRITGAPSPFVLRGVYEIEAIEKPNERTKCPFCGKMMVISGGCDGIALLNVDVCGVINGQHYCRYWTVARFRPVASTDISWAHKLVADLPKSKNLIDS